MKKNIYILLLMLITVHTVQSRDEISQDPAILPSTARAFLTKYFPLKNISYIKIDKEYFSNNKYEVNLTDGTEIEFNKQGDWQEVDCKVGKVPDGIIPEKIALHVKNNYPTQSVVKIEKKKRSYKVELSNNLELIFNRNGKFIGTDD